MRALPFLLDHCDDVNNDGGGKYNDSLYLLFDVLRDGPTKQIIDVSVVDAAPFVAATEDSNIIIFTLNKRMRSVVIVIVGFELKYSDHRKHLFCFSIVCDFWPSYFSLSE